MPSASVTTAVVASVRCFSHRRTPIRTGIPGLDASRRSAVGTTYPALLLRSFRGRHAGRLAHDPHFIHTTSAAPPGLQPHGIFTASVSVDEFLTAAIDEARQGLAEGGIPIGSVLVHAGRIIGRGHNRRVQRGSAILHGEMDALENAGRQPATVYQAATLYTTLSPCAMCSGAIMLYGISDVIVGENRTFLGEEAWLRSRGVRVTVLQDARCIEMMQRFISENPVLWNEDIGV